MDPEVDKFFPAGEEDTFEGFDEMVLRELEEKRKERAGRLAA